MKVSRYLLRPSICGRRDRHLRVLALSLHTAHCFLPTVGWLCIHALVKLNYGSCFPLPLLPRSVLSPLAPLFLIQDARLLPSLPQPSHCCKSLPSCVPPCNRGVSTHVFSPLLDFTFDFSPAFSGVCVCFPFGPAVQRSSLDTARAHVSTYSLLGQKLVLSWGDK